MKIAGAVLKKEVGKLIRVSGDTVDSSRTGAIISKIEKIT